MYIHIFETYLVAKNEAVCHTFLVNKPKISDKAIFFESFDTNQELAAKYKLVAVAVKLVRYMN